MAILVEINYIANARFASTAGVLWSNWDDVILAEQNDSANRLCSLNGVAAEHYWNAEIASFSAPSMGMVETYGGYIKMDFGNITLSPDVFPNTWPPPKRCAVSIHYTPDIESGMQLIFDGDMYLSDIDETSVTYSLYSELHTQNMLEQGEDYDGNTVPIPIAFGTVSHADPLRMPDNEAGQPVYHLAGLGTTSYGRQIVAFTSASSGAKTKVVVDSSHAWPNGTTIIINGTVNFDGEHVIESVASASFVIPVAFPQDNSESQPIYANAFTSGSFVVCDDGVPIQSNVLINGDGTFSLTHRPVGVVTVSGTASQTTLSHVMTWGASRLGIGTLDTGFARDPSPEVSCYVKEQAPVVDFLSKICAFFSHYFYIRADRMIFGDMMADAASYVLNEYDYFSARYSVHDPIKQITSRWTTRISFAGFIDGEKTAQMIRDIDNVAVVSVHAVVSGTTDGDEPKKLIDSSETFIADNLVRVGYVVQNITDETSTKIVSVMSNTTLELEDDIFGSGDEYVIGPAYSYGKEMDVMPYHDDNGAITTALENIMATMNCDTAELIVPMSTMPNPGDKITFTDTKMPHDMTTWFRVRNISYDFENEEVILGGEGEMV